MRPSYLHRACWGGAVEERSAIRSRFGPDLHLDRREFDTVLLEQAKARGAILFRPASVRDMELARGAVSIHIANEDGMRELCAAWVLDASGSSASVLRRIGGVRHRVDRLAGFAGHYELGVTEPSTLVEAANDGWWYSAPRPGGRMVTMFLTDADSPGRHAGQTAIWGRCLESAPLTLARTRQSIPTGKMRSYVAAPGISRWNTRLPVLPVGDAALSFDPIAADGICFALRSGIEAAEVSYTRSSGAAAAYRDGIGKIFSGHLARREIIYAAERRRRSSHFWQRDRSGGMGTALFLRN
jgi:flavin-dependent dehydrogenase